MNTGDISANLPPFSCVHLVAVIGFEPIHSKAIIPMWYCHITLNNHNSDRQHVHLNNAYNQDCVYNYTTQAL